MKYKKGTFVVVPNLDILAGKPIEAQTIFMWLCTYIDENGECFPSRKSLAAKCGFSVKTLDKYMALLVEYGVINKVYRYKDGTREMTSNLYQVVLPEGDTLPTSQEVTGSPQNDTLTIPNTNSTHLTIIAPSENTSAEPKEKAEPKDELPDYLGKNKLTRFVKLYSLVWQDKFGNMPTAIPFGKTAGIMKPIFEAYSEMQIASLLQIHFSWHGTTGDDAFTYKLMSNRGFSLTDFRKNVDLYIAYLTNTMNVVYNDSVNVRRFVLKELGPIISKYKQDNNIQ